MLTTDIDVYDSQKYVFQILNYFKSGKDFLAIVFEKYVCLIDSLPLQIYTIAQTAPTRNRPFILAILLPFCFILVLCYNSESHRH